MARSPIYSNQTNLVWKETWVDDSKQPKDLRNPDTSNPTIILRIMDADGSNPRNGTGTFTYVNMAIGRFNYKVVPGDFPAPSSSADPHIIYVCQYVVTFANAEVLDGDFFQVAMLNAI